MAKNIRPRLDSLNSDKVASEKTSSNIENEKKEQEDSSDSDQSPEENDDDDDEEEEETFDVDQIVNGSNQDSKNGTPIKIPKFVKKTKTRRKLNRELSNMLGDANMFYVSKEYSEAIDLLKEVVKRAPTYPDPYHTLGVIYEETNDKMKALQFYLIAATLTKVDVDLWKQVGIMAWELKELYHAHHCFQRACKIYPEDTELIHHAGDILYELEKFSKAASTYTKLIELEPDNLPVYLRIAECYHSCEQVDQAAKYLRMCIKQSLGPRMKNDNKNREHGYHALNMLCDLLFEDKEYIQTYELIKDFYIKIGGKETLDKMPKDNLLPVDIIVKYGISCLYVQEFNNAKSIFDYLLEQDLNDYDDLYIEIADAYVDIKSHDEEALRMYCFLDNLPEMCNRVEIILKKAGCLKRLKREMEALEMYKNVLESKNTELNDISIQLKMFSEGFELACICKENEFGIQWFEKYFIRLYQGIIKIKYYNLINGNEIKRKRKKTKEDEINLSQESFLPSQESFSIQETIIHPDILIFLHVLMLYAQLMYEQGNMKRFCRISVPFLFISSLKKNRATLQDIINWQSFISEYDEEGGKLKEMLLHQPEKDLLDECITHTAVLMSLKQPDFLNDIEFIQLCQKTIEALKRNQQIHRVIIIGRDLLMSKKLRSLSYRIEFGFELLILALENNASQAAYEFSRLIALNDSSNFGSWNLFHQVVKLIGGSKYHLKFLARQLNINKENHLLNEKDNNNNNNNSINNEEENNIAQIIMAGHRCTSTHLSIQSACKLYSQAQQLCPWDPLIPLCLCVTHLNMTRSRRIENRQMNVLKALAYLQQYQQLRQHQEIKKQHLLIPYPWIYQAEIMFNMARFFHELALYHLAMPKYQQVLDLYDQNSNDNLSSALYLSRDAAYNLSLIYSESGSYQLSNYLIDKYLCID